jgi:two-component system phosphate regulon sensor histidine kinase PhoR
MSVARADRRAVWIVDDVPLDLERNRRILARDYVVETFPDGSAVLERLSTGSLPDLLVIDWLMPGVTGVEVCRFLRKSVGPLANLPVLLLTAQNAPDQVAEGLDAGANDYLAKPFAEQELRARAAAILRMAELRERAEQAEAAVRRLLANAPDALVAVTNGQVSYVNEEAVRVFGKPEEALCGLPLDVLLPELASNNISVGPGEPLFPLPDVQIGDRVFAPSLRVLPGDDARTTTISLRDVTERRQAEVRRLDFYSIIAHDLRTPLAAMLLRTDLILRGKHGVLRPELVEDLRKFGGNIRSLVAMINDFLDLARLEGTGYRLTRKELDLIPLLRASLEEFQPLMETGKLSLEVSGLEGAFPLYGDRARLRQVFSNLLGNAIKFTPQGGTICVKVSHREGRARVEVGDTGRGISADALKSLFQKYARAIDTQHEVSGTGLGLMIVREIVEAHGGRVGAESEVGVGSRFWFELPSEPARKSHPYDTQAPAL